MWIIAVVCVSVYECTDLYKQCICSCSLNVANVNRWFQFIGHPVNMRLSGSDWFMFSSEFDVCKAFAKYVWILNMLCHCVFVWMGGQSQCKRIASLKQTNWINAYFLKLNFGPDDSFSFNLSLIHNIRFCIYARRLTKHCHSMAIQAICCSPVSPQQFFLLHILLFFSLSQTVIYLQLENTWFHGKFLFGSFRSCCFLSVRTQDKKENSLSIFSIFVVHWELKPKSLKIISKHTFYNKMAQINKYFHLILTIEWERQGISLSFILNPQQNKRREKMEWHPAVCIVSNWLWIWKEYFALH